MPSAKAPMFHPRDEAQFLFIIFYQIGLAARFIMMLSGSHETDARSSRHCF